jgi:predicted metalloprotease with PDZ domain
VFKRIAAFVVFFHAVLLMAQQPGVDISFTVSMPAPSSHKFHIIMQCKGLKKETVEFKMPMWMPGYYQIMNYPEKLSQFTAIGSAGERLTWNKSSTNSWKVETGGIDEFNISYDILADRSFVATSYLD